MRKVTVNVCLAALLFLQCQMGADASSGRLYDLQHSAYQLSQQKQYAKALELLKEALKLDPTDAWTHGYLGVVYNHMDRYKEAVPCFQQSFRLDPKDYQTVDGLTYALSELKMYDETIRICRTYLDAHPNDKESADLWERLAHALARKGHLRDAYAAYSQYFDYKPNDPNDWWRAGVDFKSVAAAQYLCPIYEEYRKRFPKHEGVAALGYYVRTFAQLARGESSADQKDDFEWWITHNDKKPRVSKAFYGAVKEGLRSLPRPVWEPLANAGYTVLLTPHVNDIEGKEWNEHPRGYDKGTTYANVGGLFLTERKAIVVAEYYVDEDTKKTIQNEDPSGTVCHELGHAFDDFLGFTYAAAGDGYSEFSHGARFSDAYRKDAAKLTPAVRKRLDYFLQTGDKAGQEELFAELFPILFNEADYVGSDDELLRKSFPSTIALMSELLHVPAKSTASSKPVSAK
jgi:tetratricopeptide (TPR) repeat protein